MILNNFYAKDFRNISECDINFTGGVNLLYGNNAQGKTNVIEGIYLFSRGKSHRAKEEKELFRFGTEGFRIKIDYSDKYSENYLEYAVFGREKRRIKNGYRVEKIKEFIDNFKSVLFCPDHLSLIKDGPEERRSFLNIALSQTDGAYINCYSKYKIALENRNCLIKSGIFDDSVRREILSWSEYMAEYASIISKMRYDYLKKLEYYTEKIMREISSENEEMTLIYKSDTECEDKNINEIKQMYFDKLTANIERERAVGYTLYGVHRDDILINISGKDAKYFASQGQQRSAVLALKLGEGEILREMFSEYPVYLFDDVLSELDEKRRNYVLRSRDEKQIIITSCEKDSFEGVCDKSIYVDNGVYM